MTSTLLSRRATGTSSVALRALLLLELLGGRSGGRGVNGGADADGGACGNLDGGDGGGDGGGGGEASATTASMSLPPSALSSPASCWMLMMTLEREVASKAVPREAPKVWVIVT